MEPNEGFGFDLVAISQALAYEISKRNEKSSLTRFEMRAEQTMSDIIMSEEFLAKAKSAKSFEELKAFVAVEGVEVAEDELLARWEEISGDAKKLKLSEEELDNVAGGCGTEYSEVWFCCPNCKRSYKWVNTTVPEPEDCPGCDRCGTQMYVERYE